jgi:hypothetical protein
MNVSLALTVHAIPLWFLVLSLFLPRLCIFLAWLEHGMGHFIPAAVSLFGVLGWLLIPRLLILFWIYTDQGVSLWFIIHLVALAMVWGGGSNRVYARRRVRYAD